MANNRDEATGSGAVHPAGPAGPDVAPQRRDPWVFLVLTFLLAIPIQLAAALVGIQLMPGLPVTALIFVCPGVAALILARRSSGGTGAWHLLSRVFDADRIGNRLWYVPILLLAPSVFLLSHAVLVLQGAELPSAPFEPGLALALCGAFLIAAMGEELGWSGFAIEPLRERVGALAASILLGLAWAAFHLVALVQAGRSPSWIAWWTVGTVALRVIIAGVYFNTGRSVCAASVLHATHNVAWQMFPVRGSHYDPRVTALILVAVAVLFARYPSPPASGPSAPAGTSSR